MIEGLRVFYLRILSEDEGGIRDLSLGFYCWTAPLQDVWQQCWGLVDTYIAAKVQMCINPISGLRPGIRTCIHKSFNERPLDVITVQLEWGAVGVVSVC